MWGEFFFGFALGAVLLAVPGVVVCRSARMPWAYALAVAPGCSVALYILVALGFSLAGVAVSGIALLAACVAVALTVGAGLRALARYGRLGAFALAPTRAPSLLGWELGLYVALGVMVTLLILMKPFADPSMPTQAWDNVFHFGTVRAFLDSGDWSFLNVSQYKTPVDLSANPFPGGKFYPAGWHVVTALVADVAAVPVVVAANAVNALFVGVVFPAGMFALMNVLLPGRRSAVALGAVSSVCFVAFPWTLYTSWQLFPNGAATAVLPALAFLFVAMGERAGGLGRRQLAIPFGLTLIAVAILQPNAAFSAAVFLAPYCVWFASRLPCQLSLSGWRLVAARTLAGVLAVAAIAGIWLALYRAPFMAEVVEYHWSSYATMREAAVNAATLSLSYNPPQKVLALFVFIGLAASLRRSRTAWLALSYGFALVIFVVATATDGSLKHLLAGFWYTDPCRVAALLAFAAMPLAALGLSVTYRLITGWARGRLRPVVRLGCALVLGAGCFCGAYFVPEEQGEGNDQHLETPFEYLEKQNEPPASEDEADWRRPYGEDKAAFAEEVKAIVGDAVVVNQPYDGSLYLYGVDGLHLLYRYMSGYGEDAGETEASRLIREHLNFYASDPAVREAVRQTHARYVLQLSADGRGVGRFGPAYYPERWEGISSIGPGTPGFTLVLARGNMRLYRIDGAAALEEDSLLKAGDEPMAADPSEDPAGKGAFETVETS